MSHDEYQRFLMLKNHYFGGKGYLAYGLHLVKVLYRIYLEGKLSIVTSTHN